MAGWRRSHEGSVALYLPNIAVDVLDNDEIEEVLLMRGRSQSRVANERLMTLGDGTRVRNGDDQALLPGSRLPTHIFVCGPMCRAISFPTCHVSWSSPRRRERCICVEAGRSNSRPCSASIPAAASSQNRCELDEA